MTNPADGAPLTRRQLREQAEAEAARAAAEAGPPAYAHDVGRGSTEQPPLRRPSAAVVAPAATPAQPGLARRPAPVASSDAPASAPAQPWSPSSPGQQAPETARPAARVGDVQHAPGRQRPAVAQQQVRRPTAEERQPTLSRRSLREQANAMSDTGALIVPPHQTGKIRTVDETGELTASRPARPEAAGLAAVRAPAASRLAASAPASAAPAAAGSTMSFSQRLAASAPPSARPATPLSPVQPPSALGAPVQQGAPAHANPEQGAPAPGVPSPATRTPSWTQPTAAEMTAPGMALSPETDDRDLEPVVAPPRPGLPEAPESFPEVPKWDAITTGGVAADARRHDHAQDDDLDDDFDEPDHKYTWLHYVILVAVAFVLGLILWKVYLESDSGSSSAASADATVPSSHVVSAVWSGQPGQTATDASGVPVIEEVL